MSHDKAIASGKEHRRPWRRSAAFDPTCRPGGGCPYCAANRRHPDRKRALIAAEQDTAAATARILVADLERDP